MNVLFVCTGNTCRSPMAEALLRDAAQKRGLDIDVSSAGISASGDAVVSSNARKAMESKGLSPANSRARALDEPLVEAADLILTMTACHRDGILTQYPGSGRKIYTIGEYAGDFSDVPDPFGQDLEAYKKCLEDMDRKTAEVIRRIGKDFFGAENDVEPDQRIGKDFSGAENDVKPIALGCDNAGFHLKNAVIKYLRAEKIAFTDFGAYDDEPSDYPCCAKKVADAVLSGECGKGMLFCGTGIGVSIAANRRRGIRAALCHDVFSAKATRAHNDANILTMGGRVIGEGPAVEIVKAFLETPFSGEERHMRRIGMIEENSNDTREEAP